MLDTDTKRRIDTARDILVGIVPDPKSQVEQITIALIYKFMNDMDAQSEEFGGKRKFFVKGFAQYAWDKLLRSGLGGHETLNLYAEAIAKMKENPGIPPLFREIFKDAYLTYRNPETLRMFLKVIDEFNYDHSERLGDAFEYLLSVLGSQGDAGQFRTPRHIIDFMVRIIDPKKTETVLDPACGTAGFLISAYKHILRANTEAKGNISLTPDEKGRLAQNFRGYDISPGMVRLSLVNMYLHGFADPHIAEYDTLSSQDKWNEYADVILANPPFMSPKGGIVPHKRFSVQSKRSEVLFVDYMAEHLTPSGRAAIIVPEGIIFQSGTAYKQLRKMLVEEFLVAVVSLPAGVFNPYSGVKTSILVLDKSLARRTNTIAFFKIENDGLGLGAQRRKIDKNDLPQAEVEIAEYLRSSPVEKLLTDFKLTLGLIVAKEKVAANGDFNLSGERYREGTSRATRYRIVQLGEVAEVVAGQSPPGESYNEAGTGVPFYQGKSEFGEMFIGPPTTWTTAPQRFAETGSILISVRAPVGPVNLATHRVCIGRGLAAIKPAQGRLLPVFAFYFLKSQEAHIKGDAGSTFSSINRGEIEKLQIPLPPLEVQKEIVAEIEGYQKIINGARAVIDNYWPNIPINAEWPMVELGEVCKYSGGTQPPKETFISEPREGYIRLLQIRDYKSDANAVYIPMHERHKTCEPEDVMIGRYGPPVFQILKGKRGAYNVALIKCLPDLSRLDRMWLFHFLNSSKIQDAVIALSGRVRQSGVRPDDLDKLEIPLPPLATQQTIIAEIDAEQKLVTANRELIERFEKKIQASLARVWGEEEPAQVAE